MVFDTGAYRTSNQLLGGARARKRKRDEVIILSGRAIRGIVTYRVKDIPCMVPPSLEDYFTGRLLLSSYSWGLRPKIRLGPPPSYFCRKWRLFSPERDLRDLKEKKRKKKERKRKDSCKERQG
ncbi:hypothetical protein H106_04174 [Trichophyton rubrum CBS 735.88]|nr:hypothetical protein H106_04174 [Trichophyton rubrum CBS 735.88]